MKYPTGTRFSDSVIYDEATDEVVHGFQVFRQCQPDGTPTGRTAILVPDSKLGGRLVAVQLAEDMRRKATRDAAPQMLSALTAYEAWAHNTICTDPVLREIRELMRLAIEAARGIKE